MTEEQLTAVRKIYDFASRMVEAHGANGDDTMSNEDHALWQDAAQDVLVTILQVE